MTWTWRVMTALALLIALYALMLLRAPGAGAPFLQELVAVLPLALYAHIAASALAMAIGPFQLNASFRARRLELHRWLGRVYCVSVLVGGAAGLRLAPASQGGLVAHAGFGLLAVLWLTSLVLAYRHIRAGRELEHRRWMIRNYALTFAAVTLRIYLPVSVSIGIPFAVAYPAIAWLCWVPNLVVAEWRFVPARSRLAASSEMRV